MVAFLRTDLCKLLSYIAASFLCAALLAPWFFIWGKEIADYTAEYEVAGWLEWFGKKCSSAEFDRYFKRALLLMAVLLLFPLVRWIRGARGGIGEKAGAGLVLGLRGGHKWRDLGFGVALAVVNFGIAAYVGVVKNYFMLKDGVDWGGLLLSAFVTAVVVSLLEEILFRGYLQQLLGRSMGGISLVFWTAFIFAFVHFSQPPKGGGMEAGVTWLSGFIFLAKSVSTLFTVTNVLATFSCLLGIGVILSYARMSSGSLWLGIGLHAGWIGAYKVFSKAFEPNPAATEVLLFGGNIKEGLFPLVLLVIVLGIVMRYVRKPDYETIRS